MTWQENAQIAARKLNLANDELIKNILLQVADAIFPNANKILSANKQDLAEMDASNPMYDRLLLTETRLEGIVADMRNVAGLPSPLGKTLWETERPNGMRIKKISVPFGIIGVIYEARPNVSFDVFSLCFKSGNVCVLKGGTDAYRTNSAIVEIIQNTLEQNGIDRNTVQLLAAGREATAELMSAVGVVDMVIPRGGQGLIDFVRKNSLVAVIETGAGVCHTYFDVDGDLQKGKEIIFNAKTRRVSVCNSLDCLIIHEKRLNDLPALCEKMAEKNVIIYADKISYPYLSENYPENLLKHADENSFGTEFLDYKMAVKTVKNIDEALEQIARYSSKHSECIITENKENAAFYTKMVDAACVYTNVSTAFTDGAQFGLGAEIGISTQKLHARGPMGLGELCTYKWIIEGEGQVRS